MNGKPRPALDLLVEPDWLERRLGEPDLRIVDASWYLPETGRDARAEYSEAHVPGAVYLDLSTDLADEGAAVRNTIAPPEKLASVLSRAGIGSDHRVVVYDRLGGYSAGRVWWALRYAGHDRVALLDGGLPRWVAEGRAVSREPPAHAPARFEPRPRSRWIRTRAEVLEALRSGAATLVDARSAERFRGTGVEHTRYRGHIPGARSVPYSENLAGTPLVFREPHELRKLYDEAGVPFDAPVITYCGSGVTASLTAFVLTYLGHSRVSLYDGSWAEWGDIDGLPIETGDPRSASRSSASQPPLEPS
jgi:thiosulfate/3-mercaptopyruvate sulfurtransferase